MAENSGAQKSQGGFWLSVAALAGVPFIMVLGNSMLIPVLPDIKNALNLSTIQVSLIISLFSLPAGMIIPVAGFLSDRFNRKAVIIPALIIYGSGGIIAAIASIFFTQYAYVLILTGRVLQGIGAAGTAPIAMALCGDLFKGEERSRSLGSIEASNGLGKVVSPVLGSAIGLIAWYSVFIFFPFIVIPVIAGMWLLVKEPVRKASQNLPQYLQSFARVFKKQKGLLLSSYLAGAIVLMILFGVLFYLSEYLEQQYGLDGVPKGLVLAIPVLFMSATSFITGFVIKKEKKIMLILVITGLVIMTAALAFLPLSKGAVIYFAAVSVVGIGTGLVLPCLNTLITSAATSEERGLVTSLYGSVRFFGVAFGPPLYGYMMTRGTGLMFWGSAGLALVGAVVFYIMAGLHGGVKNKPGTFIFRPEPAKKPGEK